MTKEKKDSALRDVQAELDGLIIKVEKQTARLKRITEREREASEITQTYPERIATLQSKIASSKQLFTATR